MPDTPLRNQKICFRMILDEMPCSSSVIQMDMGKEEMVYSCNSHTGEGFFKDRNGGSRSSINKDRNIFVMVQQKPGVDKGIKPL
jgi:hypothetical protein